MESVSLSLFHSKITLNRSTVAWLRSTLWLCLCLLLLTGCSSDKTIVNGLDEKEANEILVFLASKGIDATKIAAVEKSGGGGSKAVSWDITVNQDKAPTAMALLNQAGLPRRRSQGLLDIFQAGGLVPSELQEKIRYQAGLAAQIASTIRKIDGVLDAEVQISFPEEDPLAPPGTKKQKITASVYIKHSGVLDDPNSHLIPKIKRLVSSGISGLDYDNVTVIGDRARYTGTGSITIGGESEKQYVNIWSLVLAKDSVTRFQTIFFSFIVALVLLFIALLWLIWKLYPILHNHGGVKELFHLRPIDLGAAATKAEEKSKGEEKAAGKKEKEQTSAEGMGQVDEDIDET